MRFFKYLFFFSLFIIVNCSGPETLTVESVDTPPEIDGSLTDWNLTRTQLKSSSSIDYYASQHGDFLYLFVDVKSPMKDAALRQSGLIVYLSTSESSRKRKGIGYPPGSLNLLREYPVQFEGFTTEPDWGRKPENQELLENLSEDLFSSVMVIERPAGSNDPEYGFIDKSQLEIDGFELARNEDSRNMSLEMKIPLSETSFYNIQSGRIWLGFAVEPPNFDFPEENTGSVTRNQADYGRRSTARASRNLAITRSLGQSDEWFILEFN